ncbi:hypothetical protein Tco_0584065 [Tanacetum coccineum]
MSKTNTGIGLSTASDGTRNEVGLVGDTSTVMEGVKPSMIDMTMKKDKLSSLEDTTILGSFPQLSTPATTSAGNVPGKSSYANITGKPSGKKVNVRTLFTPGGNGIDVVVPVDSIHAISERFANTAYGFFLGKKVAYPVVVNYVSNTWGKYGLIRSMFSSSTKLFSFQFSSMDGLDEMLENGASEKKTVKKPSQTSRGVPIGPKIGFKFQKEYRPVTKKPNASSSGNKKNGEEHTIEGNPLVPTGIVESDSEVEVVFDETANLRISTSGKNRTDKGYGTNIAVEPWRDFTSE